MGRRVSACAAPEHMFLGDRRVLIERVILAGNTEERDEALAALLPLQRKDFAEILDAMDGLPVTIRLLDPPLHEFLPDRTELAVKVALAEAAGQSGPQVDADRKVLAAVERLHESNPMLGLRGVRLGLLTRAVRAAGARHRRGDERPARRGQNPKVEIMVPLVGSVMELHLVRDETERILTEVGAERGVTLTVPVGTMIELPRAALTAHRIADAADFFSFGTNDLTQTTWGFSRDDVESTVFAAYLEKGVFTISPFETIDADGIGRLVEIAAEEGRRPSRTSSSGLRRARWRSGVHPLLPPHRAGLRVLLTVPAAGRPPRGRPRRRGLSYRPPSGAGVAAGSGGSVVSRVVCDGARGRVGPRQAYLRTSDPPGPMPLTIRSAPVVVLLVATRTPAWAETV